jgi:hypothetical protein
MASVNRVIAILNISIFILEFSLLIFSDFTNNRGVSKGIAILYFCLLYGWLVVPSLLFLLFSSKIKGQKFINWIFLALNGAILIYNIPTLNAYIKSAYVL